MSQIAASTTSRPTLWEKCRCYLELIRFSHTIFALPFALLATAWAYVVPLNGLAKSISERPVHLGFECRPLLGILLCMVTARSFAMAVNRLLDEKWDGENPRTAGRHLPAKKLSRSGVILFTVTCAVGFTASCLLFLPNRLPVALSLPVMAFLGGYSLAKRFTQLAHFWLGIALMLAPICAWIALRGELVQTTPMDLLPAVLLGLVVLFWVAGFDIIYACQDVDYDQKAGLHSVPAKLGIRNALRVAAASHLIMWLIAMGMTFAVPALSLGWLFRGMLGIVAVLLVIEHSLVSERSLDKIQVAFFQLNSVISVLFLAVGTLDAFWRDL